MGFWSFVLGACRGLLRKRTESEMLDPENHIRRIRLVFQLTSETPDGSTRDDQTLITEPAFFDKGMKFGSKTSPSANLISQKALDDSKVPHELIQWFDDPDNTQYDIRLVDGRKLQVYGHFNAKWWFKDENCTGKEIWSSGNSMISRWLVISKNAPSKIVISWDTMVEHELLKPRSIAMIGVGGERWPLPRILNESERKEKEVELKLTKTKERAAQDKKEKEKSEAAKKK